MNNNAYSSHTAKQEQQHVYVSSMRSLVSKCLGQMKDVVAGYEEMKVCDQHGHFIMWRVTILITYALCRTHT